MTKPPLIFVETAVWSMVLASDAPDLTRASTLLLEKHRAGRLTPVISDLVLDEIDDASPDLRERLLALVLDTRPRLLPVTAEAESLANAFVENRVVPQGKPEDAIHVAVAFVGQLDVLISWNFRYIANVRRADRFNGIALSLGYSKPLRIVSPAEVLYVDD